MVQGAYGSPKNPRITSSEKQNGGLKIRCSGVFERLRNWNSISQLQSMGAQYGVGLSERVIVSGKEAPQLVAIMNKIDALMKKTVFHALMQNIDGIDVFGGSQEIHARFLGCVATLKDLIQYGLSRNLNEVTALKQEIKNLKEMPEADQTGISVLDAFVTRYCSKPLSKDVQTALSMVCDEFYKNPDDFCKKMCSGQSENLEANIKRNLDQLFVPSSSSLVSEIQKEIYVNTNPPVSAAQQNSDNMLQGTQDGYGRSSPSSDEYETPVNRENVYDRSSLPSDYENPRQFGIPSTPSTKSEVPFNPVRFPFDVSKEVYDQIITYIQGIGAGEQEKTPSQIEEIRTSISLQNLNSDDKGNCLVVLDVLNAFSRLTLSADDQQCLKRICALLTDAPKKLEFVPNALLFAGVQSLEKLEALLHKCPEGHLCSSLEKIEG